MSAAILIVAADGEARAALEPELGPERWQALQAALLARAGEWAREVLDGQDGGLIDDEDLRDATARTFAEGAGAVLVVWPDLPVLRRAHAAAALGDLQAGCDLVVGPLAGGGCYLLGIKRPLTELLPGDEPDNLAFETIAAAGLELGLLRVERGLRSPGDVAAALADPCLPAELRRILVGEAA